MSEFRRLHDDEAFSGHLISLHHITFADPDGEQFERDVVRHPGAVAVVPVHADGTVTLVRQFRAAVGETVLEVPAGTCDVEGEPSEETARRELAEEAGLRADQLQRLASVYNSPGYTDQRTVVYLATGLEPCDTGRAGVEEQWMSVETVDLAQTEAMVAGGRLVDGTTILGMLLARSWLGSAPARTGPAPGG